MTPKIVREIDRLRQEKNCIRQAFPFAFEHAALAVEVENKGDELEKALHVRIRAKRLNRSREFFTVKSSQVEALLKICPPAFPWRDVMRGTPAPRFDTLVTAFADLPLPGNFCFRGDIKNDPDVKFDLLARATLRPHRRRNRLRALLHRANREARINEFIFVWSNDVDLGSVACPVKVIGADPTDYSVRSCRAWIWDSSM